MPTIDGIDSFQHRVLPAVANVLGGWYSAINNAGTPPNHGGGGVTFDTTVKRTTDHACSLKIVTDNALAINVRMTVATKVVVGSIYFRIPARPASGSPKLLNMALSAGVASIQVDASTGQLQLKVGSGTQQQGNVDVCDDQWHRLDWKADTQTGTATLDAKVDGVDQTQATLALATANMTTIMLGDQGVAPVMTAYYSDLVWSVATADYPLGGHICLHLEINGAGTHGGTGTFADELGGTTDPALVDSIDDVWNGTTPELSQTGEDYITQTVVGTAGTNYKEFTFADSTQTGTIWGAQLSMLTAGLDSATADNSEGKLVDSAGTTLSTTGLVDGTIVATGYSGFRTRAPAAPSGGWSLTSLNACKFRWGFSTDVAPAPVMNSAILEYVAAWPGAAAGVAGNPLQMFQEIPFIQGINHSSPI